MSEQDKCESGCDKPATYRDSDGVPLCADCYISLLQETLSESQKLNAEMLATLKQVLHNFLGEENTPIKDNVDTMLKVRDLIAQAE